MKTSIVLRKVKDHLRDEGFMVFHERYICYAIGWLYYVDASIGDRDRTRVKKLVLTHLEGSPSLERWLERHHGIEMTNTTDYKRKVMATRKAWLDHLIQHYEAKGD